MALFKGFGLIDSILLILCIQITYEAASRGFFSEILKIIVLFCGIIFSFQLYPFLALNLTGKLPFLTKDYAQFLAFCLIFFSIIFAFGLLIRILNSLFKRETICSLEKMLAVFIGLSRVVLLSSVVVFLLYLFPVNSDFLKKGISKGLLKNIAPKVYLASAAAYKKSQPDFEPNGEIEKFLERDRTD